MTPVASIIEEAFLLVINLSYGHRHLINYLEPIKTSVTLLHLVNYKYIYTGIFNYRLKSQTQH